VLLFQLQMGVLKFPTTSGCAAVLGSHPRREAMK
jgi:hypothetical protein